MDDMSYLARARARRSGGGGGGSTLKTKTVNANGEYKASDDSADGYSKVTVHVPNTYEASDEGKVVNNGSLVAQTSDTATSNGTVDTTLINSLTVDVQGGDPYSIARSILDGTITEYIDPELTELRHSAFRNATKLVTLQVHGVAKVGAGCIENTKITALALPSLNTAINGLNSAYGSCGTLHYLDYGPLVHSIGTSSMQFPYLQVLILRKADGLVGGVPSSFNTTPMKQGGAGVTVYIPKALYDHLGDGTALDYKAATNWSTYDAYGTITWAQIEGSIYETQYADGTPIA